MKISSVIFPDNIHQRAKVLSSSFSGDDMLFSRLDALSGFMAMAFSTSFSSLSDTDCCLLHPDSTNIEKKDYFYNETKPRQTNEKEYCYNYNIYISAIRMQQTTIRI